MSGTEAVTAAPSMAVAQRAEPNGATVVVGWTAAGSVYRRTVGYTGSAIGPATTVPGPTSTATGRTPIPCATCLFKLSGLTPGGRVRPQVTGSINAVAVTARPDASGAVVAARPQLVTLQLVDPTGASVGASSIVAGSLPTAQTAATTTSTTAPSSTASGGAAAGAASGSSATSPLPRTGGDSGTWTMTAALAALFALRAMRRR